MRYISDEEAINELTKRLPHFDWFDTPDYMRGAVARYLMYGIPPGGFLEAVISNDFIGAVSHADMTNERLLKSYMWLICNSFPATAIRDGYVDWVKNGGWIGRNADAA